MTPLSENRWQFTREFKLQAVRLISSRERKVEEISRDLGVRADVRTCCEGGRSKPKGEPG